MRRKEEEESVLLRSGSTHIISMLPNRQARSAEADSPAAAGERDSDESPSVGSHLHICQFR